MRKVLLMCLVTVLLVGVYSFTPASAGPETEGVLVAQADAPKADAEPAKTEEKKEEPAKADEKKEEPKADAKKEEPAAAAGAPAETILFENAGKLGSINFNHKVHGEKNTCADCHEGTAPLFEKKITKVGMKMADMYAGKACGFCHDGKKVVGTATVFEAKKSCAKCHIKK